MGRQGSAAPARKVLASVMAFTVVGSMLSIGPARAQTDYTLGVDVSHHQNTIDWSKVVDSGHVFAFHKATEGATFVDNKYVSNREAAGAEDIPFGAYHYARPDGGGISAAQTDAVSEAQHFLAIAEPQPGDLLPVLDLEVTDGLPPRRLIAWTQAWLDHIEAALDVKPLIYTSPNFWRDHLNDTTTFAVQGFPLWIAHYTTDPLPRTPASNWNGNGWAFWQWTSSARVPGITGNADEDRFPGSDLSPYRIPGEPLPVPEPDPATPPVNQSPPQISGDAEVGKTLTASAGTWSGSQPLSYSYSWYRCDADGVVCEGILNGTDPAYKLVPADWGHRMKVTVTATNSAGSSQSDSSPSEPVTDTTPPATPTVTNPTRRVTLGPSINVRWAPADSKPTTFDVRYRTAPADGRFGDHVDLVSGTDERSATLDADNGTTYCLSARAIDQAGNASGWSGEKCTVAPLDDRDLGGTGSWTSRSGRKFFRNTLSQTRREGRSVIARAIRVREIRLIVQRCRGCGTVAVFFDGRRVATIDTHSRRTKNQQVIKAARFGRVRRGDVSVVVRSSDRPVKIDGLIVVRKA